MSLYNTSKERGPGFWKLNSSLLLNDGYIDGIKNIIKTVNENCKDIHSNRLRWEILKVKIKEFSVQYSICIAKRKKNTMLHLQNELNQLDELPSDTLSDFQKERINLLRQNIDVFIKEKERGEIIRSRAKWHEEAETSSKYFLSLEKSRQANNVICELKDTNNNTYKTDSEILEYTCTFYEKLYNSQNTNDCDIDDYLNEINVTNILSSYQKQKCDRPLSILEFDSVIEKLKLDKSPGNDGLTSNFYKVFWPNLREMYFDMVKESIEEGELPTSLKKAIVALLFKKGDQQLLKNYRPISLTNCDYKILAFVFSNRLQNVIDSIIGKDQTAYIKKRFIGQSARTILDVFEYCQKFNKEGIILCLDFEKAFDTLEWNFIFKVLKKYNFGPFFINCMKMIYKNPSIYFKNNGWLSRKINPSRGIRQGCPISALLFIISVEILSTKIQNSQDIEGIYLETINKHVKIKQYADDTTLILKNIESLENALHCVSEFSKCAGLNLNKSKSEGILLGPLFNSINKHCDISFTTNPVKCLGIYLGHSDIECKHKNWNEKLLFFQQTLERWKKRSLTLFGRILILKTLAISKYVYLFSVIDVPNSVKKL
jgi:hypothetical protein